MPHSCRRFFDWGISLHFFPELSLSRRLISHTTKLIYSVANWKNKLTHSNACVCMFTCVLVGLSVAVWSHTTHFVCRSYTNHRNTPRQNFHRMHLLFSSTYISFIPASPILARIYIYIAGMWYPYNLYV